RGPRLFARGLRPEARGRRLLTRGPLLRLAGPLLLRQQGEDPRQVALVLGHVGDALQRAGPAPDFQVEEVLAELARLPVQLLDAEIAKFGGLHRYAPISLARLIICVCSGSLWEASDIASRAISGVTP